MNSFKKIALAGALLASLLFVLIHFFNHSAITDSPPIAERTLIENNSPTAPTNTDGAEIDKQKIVDAYGKLPLHFEPNLGQTDAQVKFLARGHGYALFLTEKEAVLSLQKRGKNKAQDKRAIVKMQIEGANEAPQSAGLDETASKSNYFVGNDSAKWQSDVPNYSKVKYEQIYNGVDLVYYGNNQRLEYDFLVRPDADPNQIKLKFDGVKSARIDKQSGDLLLETEVGTLRQHAPVVYQNIDGERKEIASAYAIIEEQAARLTAKTKTEKSYRVTFKIAGYDKSKELVIDPILAYGSYLGGSIFDEGRSIAVDSGGNAYIVGTAASRDFPTTAGTVKPVMLPREDAPNSYWYDAFVTKVNPTGTAIVYSTYFGGRNGNETGSGVAVDASGNVLLSGSTMSPDFPLVNAYSSTYNNIDMNFAAKLNSTGSAIIYSTYLGTSTGAGSKIAVNPATGDAFFAGNTGSANFPTTPGAYKERLCDTPQGCPGVSYSGGYIVKFSAAGSAIYSTLFPNTGINDVALDADGNAVVGGTAAMQFATTPGAFQPATSGGVEGFVAKLNAAGNALVFGTFLGGGLQSDRVKGVAVDLTGNVYATGQTENGGFPTTAGAFDRTFNGGADGFLTKFNPAGSALVYSTFYGGAGKDEPFAVGLGADNSAFVTGETLSGANFPLKNSINGTNGTIFLTRFNTDATALVFSTLLGQGGAYDLAVDGADSAYITGHTTSIIVTPNSFQPMKGEPTSTSSGKDAFVLKIAPTDENVQHYNISGTVTDPTQYGNYQPIVVTVTGTINRSVILPYGNGSGVIPYFFGNLPAGGNYTVTVKKTGFLTDPESASFNNLSANQFADFTILNNEAPVGVVTAPAHGTNYSAPASITIQATASDPDGDPITKVDFVAYHSTLGNIPLGTDTTAPYEFTWTNVPVGTWSLNAIPTDSKGLRGVSTPVVHVFVNDAAGLSVSITSPTEGQTFAQGSDVPLTASVSSSVRILEFYDQNNNLIGRRTGAPWSTSWRVMQTGNYTVTAKVYNSQGESLTSPPVSLVVNPINHRIAGRIFNLTANAPIPNIALNLTSSSNPNVSATTTTDSNGNYLFTDFGATVDDSVTITPVSAQYTFEPQNRVINYLGYIHRENENFWGTQVTQINVAMTSPSAGQTFTAPAAINLAANAASGAGTITKVEFYRQQGAQVALLTTDTTAPYEHQLTGVAAGNYEYFARAADSTGAITDSQPVGVTVNAPVTTVRLQGDITNPNGAPMQGIRVNLTGTANGSPVNQTSISLSTGAYGFFNLPAGGNYTITPQGVGELTFLPASFSVTNATGDNLDIDFASTVPNQSPGVTINSPTNGAVFTMPAAIPVNVTATDPDGTIVHLTVSAVGNSQSTSIGQSNNGTFNAPWQPNRPGEYRLWAQARDNGGFITSVFIDITVNPPAPVGISGRIVDRNSVGIEGVTLELRNYPEDEENPQPPVATVTTDASGNYTIPNVATFGNYILRASKMDYTFSPRQRIYFNPATSQTGDFTGTMQVQPSEFDGDGRSDLAVWRPETGDWHVLRSSDNTYTGTRFGGGSFGDIAVPGNYDGDRKTDLAVYRPSDGTWYIAQSSNGQVRAVQFGIATDKPAAGDFDGDGKTDFAVFRPSNGYWYILGSTDNQFIAIQWGTDGDTPLAGDFDGDGLADVTVFRPSDGTWYVRRSTTGNLQGFKFGQHGDVPLVGDFDGDKQADFTVFRPSDGVWYVWKSSDNSLKAFKWGTGGDKPVPGDFDRDGKTDFAVFRPSDGNWYIFRSTTNSYTVEHFGANGDVPIPAAYVQ
ncbi:MAG TPA: Ig-like domain-containing protein [Pyrinomonadaceae bacterium]